VALSDDQRAMLQLLLQRDQSYEDIASLLGLDVDQVRIRARTALTEIGGEDPDRAVGLTDYLLGQADPIGRADVARHLQSDADARSLAERLANQLRVLAPGAEVPELTAVGPSARRREPPPLPEPAPAASSEPARRPWAGFGGTLSKQQRQAIAGLLGGGLLVVVIALIAGGAFGGDDGSNGGSDSGSDGSSQQTTNAASNLTRAVLTPQGGGNAQGVAVFAQVRNTPLLQVNVTNLEPTPAGQAYVIWLYGGPRRAFPLVRQRVGKDGQMRGATPIPTQLIQALQQRLFDSIDVSLASNAAVTAALRQARRSQRLPPYAGTSVVRGPIEGPGFTTSQSGSGSGGDQ
jgi:hypothetical protein